MSFPEIFLGIAATLLALPSGVFLLQVLSAWGAGRHDVVVGSRPRVAILIPAHNEEAVIGDCLGALGPQLTGEDRLLVVADNCSDGTAALAAGFGAEVLVRQDPLLRGKGYALDFGMRRLRLAPPDVVVIVDADCQVDAGAVDRIAREAAASGRPVQALYLMQSPRGAGLAMRLAEFAWRVRNWARPLGYARLGLPCQLMGTGMAFPWALADHMALASSNIVEDMKLGIDLALAGHPPLFCPDALVTSRFPLDRAAGESQRTRWEHGHLQMILGEFPRLLGRGLRRGDARVVAMALDLAVPPLALLSMAALAVAAAACLLPGGGLLGWAFLPLGMIGAAVGLAWLGWGRQVVSVMDLLSVPLYLARKVPLYGRFLTRRQRHWVKTGRD
ncbi:MAG: glycosyltransferase [Rhodocyclaceae bacterium]|nr:MAG: glycosyltransferase [Rhodocyclaceae bacterium]